MMCRDNFSYGSSRLIEYPKNSPHLVLFYFFSIVEITDLNVSIILLYLNIN